MKKIMSFFCLMMVSAAGCIGASASTLSPVTGQQISPVPYVLGGIALVLIIVIAILSFINKKNNKK